MSEHLEMLKYYFSLMNSNGVSHVYREALQAGLLDALAAGPQSTDDVASRCQTNPRATGLVFAALEACGLVREDEALWDLTALAKGLLTGGYRHLGDQYWAHLPEFLRSGQPWIKMDEAAQSEAHYQAQAASLAWMLTPAAQAASRLVQLGNEPAILDVGAGSAIWSLTMATRHPGSTVLAVDWPAVLEVAKETARRFGLDDRLKTLPGNLQEVTLPPAAFDLAFVANVTHLLQPDENDRLLRKVHAALKPSGQIAVVDIFPGDSQGDINRTLYALGLALRTAAGRVYSAEELTELLTSAGFEQAELMNLPAPPHAVGLLLARRNE